MKIVVDTNVLVSGLWSPHGPPGEIVGMLAAGTLEACFDVRLLDEYREVLRRPRFAFTADEVGALLEQIEARGHRIAARPLPRALPDPDDDAVLEIAVAAGADFLITGNLRDFPLDRRHGVRVVDPRAFIEEFRKRQ